MRGVLPLLAVLTVLLGTQGTALPDEDPAGQHHETGKRLFQEGEYRRALEEFRAAHVARPDPAFLYDSAQCHHLLGERREALALYRQFLSLAPGSPKRPVAERQIRELEVATVVAQPVGQLVSPVQAPAPADTPRFYRRWWFWAALGTAAAGAVTAVLISNAGRFGDPPCPNGVKCFR